MSTELFDKLIFAWWWLPDDPDNMVPGYVKFESGKSVEVHVLGFFKSIENPNPKEQIPVIYGRGTSRDLYTLSDVDISHQVDPHYGHFREVYLHSSCVFIGAHVPTPIPAISEIVFTPSGLKEWAGSDKGIRFDRDKESSVWKAQISNGEWRDSLVSDLEGGVRLSVDFFHMPSFSFEKALPVEHSCRCHIAFAKTASLEECFEKMKIFCDFLSFATRVMSGFESYSARIAMDDELNDESNWVKVVGLNSALEDSSEKRSYAPRGRNYFNIRDIESQFDSTMSLWFTGASKFDSAYHLYFAIASRTKSTYLEHEFFTYVQILEGFCGKNGQKGRFMTAQKEYRKMVDDVVYPFLRTVVDENLALAMRGQLYMANSLTLREHLTKLLDARRDEFIQKWIPGSDVALWISKVVSARSDYAHVLDHPDSKIMFGDRDFTDTVLALRLLVEAQLLEMIGFSQIKTDEILNHTFKVESSIAT